MWGVIQFLFEEVFNLWKFFVKCRLNTVTVVYRAVKFTSGQITPKREELLFAMKIVQKGRQAVERMMWENRRITVDDIAEALNIIVQHIPSFSKRKKNSIR
jgi:threonine dehydrogenase-like Zn-dependent dehydrogenase